MAILRGWSFFLFHGSPLQKERSTTIVCYTKQHVFNEICSGKLGLIYPRNSISVYRYRIQTFKSVPVWLGYISFNTEQNETKKVCITNLVYFDKDGFFFFFNDYIQSIYMRLISIKCLIDPHTHMFTDILLKLTSLYINKCCYFYC